MYNIRSPIHALENMQNARGGPFYKYFCKKREGVSRIRMSELIFLNNLIIIARCCHEEDFLILIEIHPNVGTKENDNNSCSFQENDHNKV